MYVASLVFLGGAAVTLALGIQAEGLGLLYASIGCSAVAGISAIVSIVRRMVRSRAAADRRGETATSPGGG